MGPTEGGGRVAGGWAGGRRVRGEGGEGGGEGRVELTAAEEAEEGAVHLGFRVLGFRVFRV